jgi:hypothetical protein
MCFNITLFQRDEKSTNGGIALMSYLQVGVASILLDVYILLERMDKGNPLNF